MIRLYPRHRLDLSLRHVLYAAAACAWARDAGARARRLEAARGDGAVVCFSVRSGFELLLDALDLPRGTEALVSAVTHPDMATILERHGLVPVPVDLDPETLAPDADEAAAAVTPRTRLLVVAHLFGGRVDLTPLVEVARRHGLVLVEDCAQSLRGADDGGDARADVTMFSFGSIKTCPALGGAVLHVRDEAVRARMHELSATWPVQPRREYARRVGRFAALVALQHPVVYGAFVRTARALGRDVDAAVNETVRALRPPSPGAPDAFAAWLRRRPSAPLLALLERRLRTFDQARLAARKAQGEEVAAALPSVLFHPGRRALDRTHWVFPVVPREPRDLIRVLRAAGFDATAATTSIAVVPAPPGRPLPRRAAELMRSIVFLPVYPELPPGARRRLLRALESEPLAAHAAAVSP